MVSIKRGLRYFAYNRAQFCDYLVRNFLKFLPDKVYLTLRYRCKVGKWINWKNPQTFTEKLQWLKLYNRQGEYSVMVDKYAVKQYVSNIIGSEYIIPTLGVWDNVDSINWESLPDQFVLKTTHGGGGCGVVICRNKRTFDKQDAIVKLNQSLKQDIYLDMREWPYKAVPRRIIAEKFISSPNINKVEELKDYKFFCFGGKVKFLKVDFGRFVEHHANYYLPDKTLLRFGENDCPPIYSYPIEFPQNFPQMVTMAEKLSEGCPFLRVDMYSIGDKIYFGELTFYPASGFGTFTQHIHDKLIGEMLNIPN